MTSTLPRRTAVVPERYGWALTVLALACGVTAVACAFTLWGDVWNAVTWLTPGSDVPTTFTSAVVLPGDGLQNHYAGGPFVADGRTVTATALQADVTGLGVETRLGLSLGPVLWDATIGAVALVLLRAVRALRGAAGFSDALATPLIAAAAVLAVGSTAAQVLGMLATLGFGWVMWSGRGIDGLGGPQTVTFQFAPLVVSAALVAVALVLRRAAALQRDVTGLV